MPYITKSLREQLDDKITEMIEMLGQISEDNLDGCLNYTISRLLIELYERRYAKINRAIGVLECVKLEYYRRFAAPYEDKKASENGDIYG